MVHKSAHGATAEDTLHNPCVATNAGCVWAPCVGTCVWAPVCGGTIAAVRHSWRKNSEYRPNTPAYITIVRSSVGVCPPSPSAPTDIPTARISMATVFAASGTVPTMPSALLGSTSHTVRVSTLYAPNCSQQHAMPQRGSQPLLMPTPRASVRRAAIRVKAVAAPEAAPKLAIAGDVSSLIGNTPMVYLNKITQGIDGTALYDWCMLHTLCNDSYRRQDCCQA